MGIDFIRIFPDRFSSLISERVARMKTLQEKSPAATLSPYGA
jgi:hypothetical protein